MCARAGELDGPSPVLRILCTGLVQERGEAADGQGYLQAVVRVDGGARHAGYAW